MERSQKESLESVSETGWVKQFDIIIWQKHHKPTTRHPGTDNYDNGESIDSPQFLRLI